MTGESMADIREIPYDESTGLLREMYDEDLKDQGYIDNSTSIFSLRPDVVAAFKETIRRLRTHIRLRRYELVTIAAAKAMRCKF